MIKSYALLDNFITMVKTECVLNHHYFSMYDVPDLIMKKNY